MKESKSVKPGKLTVKHQVTIPVDVRKALGLKAGDHVMFDVKDGHAEIYKICLDEPSEKEWHRFTMSQMTEWATPEEDQYWSYLEAK